jgi:hypothetical protein
MKQEWNCLCRVPQSSKCSIKCYEWWHRNVSEFTRVWIWWWHWTESIHVQYTSATLKEMYTVDLTLRNNFLYFTSNCYKNWPPHASDITGENIRKLASPLLFNFMDSWVFRWPRRCWLYWIRWANYIKDFFSVSRFGLHF